MNKPFFKSRICKVFYFVNGKFLVIYRNAMVVGCLHKRNYSSTRKLLLALSVNKPFRLCKGTDDNLTINILDYNRYDDLCSVARRNFPNASIY